MVGKLGNLQFKRSSILGPSGRWTSNVKCLLVPSPSTSEVTLISPSDKCHIEGAKNPTKSLRPLTTACWNECWASYRNAWFGTYTPRLEAYVKPWQACQRTMRQVTRFQAGKNCPKNPECSRILSEPHSEAQRAAHLT
eukprot:3538608-Amphidinium_carterae.1